MLLNIKSEEKPITADAPAVFKSLLRNSTVTASATVTFQEVLRGQFIEFVVLFVGVFTAVGAYYAVSSALERRHIKKLERDRFESIMNLYDNIRRNKWKPL